MNVDALKLKLTAVFEPAPEGGFTSHFEELPEVFSEGETVEEAKANLLDALTQVMEYHRGFDSSGGKGEPTSRDRAMIGKLIKNHRSGKRRA